MLGWHAIARDYYTRFRRPMMLTETNTVDHGARRERALAEADLDQAHHLRHQGVPVIGYTWYSLTDQIDWDIQIAKIRGKVNANGLFTLDRKLRDVANVYRELAHCYGDSPLIETMPAGLRHSSSALANDHAGNSASTGEPAAHAG